MSEEQELPEWIWCLVGNVVREREYGPDHEIRKGTKRFKGGTKVYCYPSQWGDGYERIYVLGKPRNRFGFIRVIMRRTHIENFRLQRVYNKEVIQRMNQGPDSDDFLRGWDDSDEDRMEIKDMVTWLNLSEKEQRHQFTLMVLQSMVLESTIDGCPDGAATLRIERRHRSDSRHGGAWYGFCSLGGGQEREVGMLEWYGIGPDGEPYVPGKGFHDNHDLAYGLCDAGIYTWDEHCESPANYGGPSYSWRITVGIGEKAFTCSGRNAHPDTLPSVYRLLTAWGFPSIWDSELDAPCAHVR